MIFILLTSQLYWIFDTKITYVYRISDEYILQAYYYHLDYKNGKTLDTVHYKDKDTEIFLPKGHRQTK